ncbi:hypothetical protein GOP47_0013616 [Adiantum capillus-veneris]|uniref:DUF4378 domain-containing protein n=1 Tax=Adiantum capillus-veneris TaxID=13818 RepID=A0A9D4ZFH8_ADICA|nr:hypothetical protein GOP47_0013616 [Adiantum capillus-veneris]
MFYSVPSSSPLDQNVADKGSCPGTFFHLFDWNCHSHHGRRFFGHKSNLFGKNPSETTDKACNHEALPGALVANDENRCEFSPANQTSLENRLLKDQKPEKSKKKSPNVVAKLMGLETMPSPDPCRRQRRPLDLQHPNLMRTPDKTIYFPNTRVAKLMGLETMPSLETCRRQRRPLDLQHPNLMRTPDKTAYFPNSRVLSIKQQRNHEGDGNLQGCSIRSESSRKNLLADLSCKQGVENETTDKHQSHDEIQSGNDPVISSQTKDRVHNKVPSATRPAQTSFNNSESAQGNIKGDEEKPTEPRSKKVESLSSPASTQDDYKMVKGKEFTSVQTSLPAVRAQAEKNKAGAVSMGQGQVKHVKKDKYRADGHSGRQHFGSAAKRTQGFKKTEQTNNQLCQIAGVKQQDTGLQKAKAKISSSPLKESFQKPENFNNQKHFSVDSTVSCIEEAGSSCSTKSNSRHKRLSSTAKSTNSKERNKIKLCKTGTGEITSPDLRSLGADRGSTHASTEVAPSCKSTVSSKHAQRSHRHILKGYHEGTIDTLESDVDCVRYEENHSNPCGVEDMHSTGNSVLSNLQEKSELLGSSLTFENGILEGQLHDGDVQGSSDTSISSTFQGSSGNEAVTSTLSVSEIPTSTCQSSIEDVGDIGSSYENKCHRQTVSYSGKSTATILKELLMALNPSTKEFITGKVCTSEEDSSTLELNYFRNADRADSPGIDYSKGSVWNSYAVEDTPCEDLFRNTFQLNSNLELVLPSKSEPVGAPESYSLIQEKAACEKEISRSFFCKSFHPGESHTLMSSIDLSSYIQNSLEKAMESEESYVQYILSSADLSHASIISARMLCSGLLIEPRLFDVVEASCQSQWKWGIQHDCDEDNHSRSSDDEFVGFSYTRAAHINRKLVFDCIEEALRQDMGITDQESMQTTFPVIDPPAYDLCSKRVQRQIDDWQDMACGLNVDDMVEKEMNSGLGKWHDFSSEMYHISVEIELSILRDLIDELVPILSTGVPSVSTMMTYKWQGAVKAANKDKYFWVGL